MRAPMFIRGTDQTGRLWGCNIRVGQRAWVVAFIDRAPQAEKLAR
jgi:hypothetical protein